MLLERQDEYPVMDLVSTVEPPTLNDRREPDDQAAASG